MARQTQKRTIDGVTFEVTQLGFAKARQAFVKLAKAAGPVLVKLADGADSLANLKRSANLMGALETAIENLSDDDLAWFADAYGDACRFSTNGSQWPYLDSANREELFAGRLMLFFKWLAFATEVNFSDFLGAFEALPEPARDTEKPGS